MISKKLSLSFFAHLGVLALFMCACGTMGTRKAECQLHGGREWREVQSDHFRMQTNVDSKTARDTLQNLEWTLSALLKMWSGRFDPPTDIDVVLVRRPSEWEEFGELWVAGKMIPSIPRPMIVLVRPFALGDISPARRVVAHELTHYLSRHIFVQTPIWFEEGFAQFMETLEDGIEDRTVVFGRPDARILRHLQIKAPLPLSELWGWGTKPISDKERVHYYASSFAWVHYLYNHHLTRFSGFWNGLANGGDPREIWKQAFDGVDEDLLFKELKRYLINGQYQEISYSLADKTIEMTEITISPAEVHLLRAKLFAVGAKDPSLQARNECIHNELTIAVNIDKGNVEVQAELIRLDENPERQWESAKKLVEAHPDNIAALKIFFHVLQKREDKNQIENILTHALELAPQDPQILGALALFRADAGDNEEALELIKRAVEMAPWHPWVLGTCAVVAAASGACDQAKLFEYRALIALPEAAADPIRKDLKKLLAPVAAACNKNR